MSAATCPACGCPVRPGDAFCEACGHRLGDAPVPTSAPNAAPGAGTRTCPLCGGNVAPDGYCERCGARAPAPRDHLEDSPAPWVAGVTDRGLVHTRNEDALALHATVGPGSFAVLVVCDGVSSVPRSDEASAAATEASLALLRQAAEPGAPSPDWTRLLPAAARAGDQAGAAVAGPQPPDPDDCPSCTLVAAVVDAGRVFAASVGDSRAYWLPDDGPPHVLTTDDSWAQEMIAAGTPREVAENAPRAHAITQWLGPDSPPVDPAVSTLDPDGPGWLCVCSDGLWNYCSNALDLAPLVRATAAAHDQEPLATARALVGWVIGRGARDNVTVTLARLPATTPAATG